MVNEDQVLTAANQPPRWPIIAGGGAYLLLVALGIALGGEIGQIALAGLNALPFAVLAVLAYLGGRSFNWAWIATILWLMLLVGGATLIAVGSAGAALFEISADTPTAPAPTGGEILQIGLILAGVLVAIGLGVLCMIAPIRRVLARMVPIDPESFVHTVALACVVTVGLICVVPLLVIGAPPLLAAIAQAGGDSSDALVTNRDSAGQLRDQVYSLIWTIPAAVLAVGYGVRRNLAAALQRLGFVRPTLRQVLAGVGIALLLAGAVQLIGAGIDWLWNSLGWATTDEEAFSELLAFALNPIGAIVIGVTAGLGEELAVRGVLQPRLGLIVSNLFFTSLHALQYNWDALLIVFLVGMVCGIVRNRTNTSTAAIVHGTYNFSLIMLSITLGT
ncbi:MAG: CPBP family intramembrane metalloprotease [Oscillochloris sp.]|nr:CPBP family intramembrane metalloprotease [Oscillochloris sp.]